jgi:hypothetical protein
MALVPTPDLIQQLAYIALELHSGDGSGPRSDILLTEIIDAWFDQFLPETPVNESFYEDGHLLLRKIRDLINQDYQINGTFADLVPATHFEKIKFAEKYGQDWQVTERRAHRFSVPRGKGKKAVGLHFRSKDNDPVFVAHREENLNKSAGGFSKNMNDVLDATEQEVLSPVIAGEVLREAAVRAAPKRPDLRDAAIRAVNDSDQPAIESR